MRILVVGAGGIIGQHMMASEPEGVDARFARRYSDADNGFVGINVSDHAGLLDYLVRFRPDAIINLAGQNSPDRVEQKPEAYRAVNVEAPAQMAAWCKSNGAHMVQVSTQAVFGGLPIFSAMKSPIQAGLVSAFGPPYSPNSPRIPVNEYGRQKLQAECEVAVAAGDRWTVVRPTFVLGVRKLMIGRENPVEQMLSPVTAIAEGETVAVMRQVCDRWFSVAFAWDVAAVLWKVAMSDPMCKPIHVGVPFRTNRHILASYLRPDLNVEAVSHDSFEGLAPRPIDTTYAGDGSFAEIAEGLDRCKAEFEARESK